MECPICGAELIYDDYYKQYGKKVGDIYRCPHAEEFETFEDVKVFVLKYTNFSSVEDYLKANNLADWHDIRCDSAVHNVCGSFYTDANGDLYDGYPC